IKLSSSSWLGKLMHQNNTDGIFEQFSTFEYGLRAMIKQVKTDIDKGHNSIAKLISKYAPSKENTTENYIKYVAAQTGIDRNAGLVSTKTALRNLIKAMVRFENGQNYPVSDKQFEEAYKLL
ncbi:hypothetical protein, partial [Desulfonatronum sp. SC1]|uniref:hypothetical protein n=1 Tax=Desulfonatronum sp. SC1 TaxID=2109626 RepID=UPI001E60D33A